MKIRLCVFVLLSYGITVMLTNTASPNGINPPPPKEAVTTTASCQENSGGRQHELLRTRITNGNNSMEFLTLRIGGTSQQLAITDIKSVALTATSADRNGFMPASLLRRGGSKEEAVAVQIRSNGSAYNLSGFTQSSSRFSIELARCRRIEFSNSAAGAMAEPSPVRKN